MMKFYFWLLLGSATNLFSQWNSNKSINTAVATATKSQQNNHSVPDKKNGVIIGWDDNRNNLTNSTDIYAQRLNSDGITKWVANGVAVCTNTNTQRSLAIVEDGNGGAILTWEDSRAGNYDIYAQKIDSNGVPQWTIDGVMITNGLTTQKNPKIINDNAGGAIIVWEDSLNFYFDVYAQRINSAGTILWAANGVPICTAVNTQNNAKIDIDGLGGAVITWQDKRNGIDTDIYAQRIDATGTTLWAANGVVVCSAPNTQNNPRIEPDGSNGAIIAWTDKRGGIDYDVYAQRLTSAGINLWTANGVSVCNSTANQSALDIKYLGSSGGVALSWKDQRGGSFDIYTQIISLSTGTNVMAVNGVKISNSLKSLNPNNIADGSGGVIVAWQDSTTVGWDITSQKINLAGVLQWTTGGVTVSNATGDQINVSNVYDGFGGSIYIWEDHRNTNDYDIFAQHLFFDGTATVGINELKKNDFNVNFFPNPANSSAQIHLSNCSMCTFELLVHDGFGRLVKQEEVINNNEIILTLNGLNEGMYHYSLINREKAFSYNGTFILEK